MIQILRQHICTNVDKTKMAHHDDKKTLKMRLKTDFSKLHQTSQEHVSIITSKTKSNRIEKSSTTQQDLFQ